MTVNFSTEISPIAGFAITCGTTTAPPEHRFGTYSDALALLQAEFDAHGFTGGLSVCHDEGYCPRGPV